MTTYYNCGSENNRIESNRILSIAFTFGAQIRAAAAYCSYCASGAHAILAFCGSGVIVSARVRTEAF